MRTIAGIIGLIGILLLTSCQPQGEWTSLFNGKNLDGWMIKCLPQDSSKIFWTVDDGAITCNSMGYKNQHNYVWLMSAQEYGDFELEMKIQAFKSSPGNSGVQIRSRYDESDTLSIGGWLNGPQIDIHPPTPWRTGLIYDETRGEQRWIYPSLTDWKIDESHAVGGWTFKYADEGWNDLHIICKGTHIKAILNGTVITDFDGTGILDNEAHKKHNVGLKGHIAFQLHNNDELLIKFKDILIKEL